MRVTAIIAEYNPLHNGHAVHIETARNETGADFIVTVMSGDHVQRGCPSVISKYERTRSALLTGADLVIELPVQYSTGSLEYFAMGAVSLIRSLGIVDCISFGSECGDIDLLKEASEHVLFRSAGMSFTDEDRSTVKNCLSSGLSYSQAVNLGTSVPAGIRETLSTPNNLLAAAYIKAADSLSFDCGFHTMKRAGSDYHDISTGALSSSALRKELSDSPDDLNNIRSRMPDNVFSSLRDYLSSCYIMDEDDYSLLLFYKLLEYEDDPEGLTAFFDVSPSLAHKIINEYRHAPSYSGLCAALKSRDINYSRISRALLHILLDLRAGCIREYILDGWNYYIKPLGFRRSSSALIHELKHRASLPVISKNADAAKALSEYFSGREPAAESSVMLSRAVRMFREGILASDLYNKTACIKCRQQFLSEYERSMLII